jgi:hypothetical protein
VCGAFRPVQAVDTGGRTDGDRRYYQAGRVGHCPTVGCHGGSV